MVILSKSISGFGLPMSILLMKPEYDIFKPAEHNGTFRGNQLAFVGSKAGMEYYNNFNLEDTVRKNEKYISEYLSENIAVIDDRLKIRGIGMIWGIDFADIDPKLALEASHRCFDKGLVIELAGRNDSVLKILPPLTIEKEYLDKGLEIITREVKQLLR
jgi:diaminobutyrate-2-oxoglutarate transaminase